MVTSNSINANTTGVVAYNGSGIFTATPITNHNVLVGSTSNGITSVAPGASGTALCGNGVSADPSFQSVAGVGSTVTQHYALVGGASNSIVSVTPSTAGLVLTSNGTSSDPSFQSIYTSSGWTPGISFGGGTTGITYSTHLGSYTQIGNVIFFYCLIALSNKGSSTGNAAITGFPGTVGISLETTIGIPDTRNITYTATYTSAFLNTSGTSGGVISLYQYSPSSGVIALTNTNFANNSRLELQGFYFTT